MLERRGTGALGPEVHDSKEHNPKERAMTDQDLPREGGDEGPVLPPPPVRFSSGSDAWQAGPALESGPPRRVRPRLVIGAVAVVVALVAGFVAVQLTRSEEKAEAQALAFAFTQGQTQTYLVHMAMNGTMAMEGFGQASAGEMPLEMDMTETVTWKVLSVDGNGVATIEASVTHVSGTVNGVAIPDSAAGSAPTQMKIAPNGRLLDVGGMSIPSSLQGAGGLEGVPGLDQYTPLLPDYPVEPGDSWTKVFREKIPFGRGTMQFTTVNTFDRYEVVNGVRAAVITTGLNLPLDFTIDFDKLLAGQEEASGGVDMSGVSASYGGEVSLSVTAWVDPSAKQLLKSSASGDIDMTMEMSGAEAFEGQMTLKGTFSEEMVRK
jgi:hypothetical protein